MFNDSTLQAMEEQKTQNRFTSVFNSLAQKHMKEIYQLRRNNDQEGLMNLQDSIFGETQKLLTDEPAFKFTDEQRQAYTTVGGTPHLDGEYTVFGEVIDGMDVVDKIQQVATNASDRPDEDIVIKKVSIVED